MTSAPPWESLLLRPLRRSHVVQFASDDDFRAEAFTRFVGAGIRGGEAVVVSCLPHRWRDVARRLASDGVDVVRAEREGELLLFDPEATLPQLLVDGSPDAAAFEKTIDPVVAELRLRFSTLRVCGEMVDLLWQRGDRDGALRLEHLWSDLQRRAPLELFCSYSLDLLRDDAYDGPIDAICRSHSHVIPTRHYDRLDEAVMRASAEVLDLPLAHMMRSLSASHRPETEMPFGQATLLWLKENMPITAAKVLDGVRRRVEG